MRRFVAALFAVVFVVSLAGTTSAFDDVSGAYAHVKPALVKVWSFDKTGVPTDSGTGFVVQSDTRQSWIVTASHVVDGANTVRVDVSRDLHDIPASIVAKTSKRDDITLLLIAHGSLSPVTFATRSQNMVEGKFVATAGYFQNDEQIGATGQAPRLVGPGTVGSLIENGNFIGINLNVEEGLSGAPVFDSNTGNVIGVVDVKAAAGPGGYAVSAPLIVLGFLSQNRVVLPGEIAPIAVAVAAATPISVPTAIPTPVPTPLSVAAVPAPVRTLAAVARAIAPIPTPVSTPAPKPVTAAPVPVPVPAPVRTVAPIAVALAPATAQSPLTVGKANQKDVDECFGRVPVKSGASMSACSNLIAISAPNALLYDRRCVAEWRNHLADFAIADCSQALRIDPNNTIAYTYRAASYDSRGLWDLAIADANKAIALNPNYAAAYAARGRAYEGQKSNIWRGLALDDYDKAVSLDANLSFFLQKITHMPFVHTTFPPTLGTPPSGSLVNAGTLYAVFHGRQCISGALLFYNDYTQTIYFNLFGEAVREQSEADPTHWTKEGRIRLGPGESKSVSMSACRGPRYHYWIKDVRFGNDIGPVIFPSQDNVN